MQGPIGVGRSRVQPWLQPWLQHWISRLVLSPTIAVMAVFLYGFVLWTFYVSLTPSTMLPRYEIVGLLQYQRLFANLRWSTAYTNLFVFGGLFITATTGLGLLVAILLDRHIRAEGVLRAIFLYPMSMSFVVTGLAWKWILNPDLGVQRMVRDLGFPDFAFDWLGDPRRAILTLVIAGTWQSTGFVMALFLAGLRGIDGEILKAARVDGAPAWRLYAHIVIPMLRPVFLTAIVLLSIVVLRSFDLVVALTGGGPGFATDLPARFMVDVTFRRDQIGLGAASAMVMLATFAAIFVPYLYSELRPRQ
jgi:glucose/mannose transport system permease protein